MTLMNQRYLYVLGGDQVESTLYNCEVFERLDLKMGKTWELILFKCKGEDFINQARLSSVAMMPYN